MQPRYLDFEKAFDASMLHDDLITAACFAFAVNPVKRSAITTGNDGRKDPQAKADQSGSKTWQSARKCSGRQPLWRLSPSAAARPKRDRQASRWSISSTKSAGQA